ncbi:LysR family transcriptional regulator [Paenibacillus sp. UMB7766-LJ446]|uniref:LysR family transcriptional regulator n=1 Tax=Paenibacillus sp. UMB7766-LJ446 TaxID=3046313 RepID=UPI00254AEF87|nr:LysR family transcriptional regulator [Paenibacillus sp. UMB7766-LJ446]MDK8193159.1 LysR family transcriptional regulator [Paenibacillus sp. UMB7766-LJ446]
MELRHLITFKTIVEKEGFKKAAEHLGYAQSSITAHIKELEKEVGNPLFDRLGKRIVLTQYGQHFLSYAVKIIDLYSEALLTNEEPTGELTIGIAESLTIDRIPAILLEFKNLYPNVNLSVKSIENYQVASRLQSGEIDLVVVFEKDDWSLPELNCEVINKERMVLISPPKKENSKTVRTVLYTEKSCSYKAVFDHYINKKQIDVKESLDFQSIEAIKQCVKSGLGISLVPYFSVKEEVESGKLWAEDIEADSPAISTFIAYHKYKWLSPALVKMISLIKNHSKSWE